MEGAPVDDYNSWVVGRNGLIVRYSEKFLQTDTTASQRTAYCAGDTVTVSFDTIGVFSAAERVFRVELSNRMGRFRSHQTTILPLVGAATASPLRAVLPANLPAGMRYRMRVIRADSSVLGGDNTRDLSIYPRPAAVAVSPLDSARLCAGDSVQLVAPAGYGQYAWSTGATGASVWVKAAGAYSVRVAAGGGCFSAASAPVVVRLTPRPTAPVVSVSQTGSGPALLTAVPSVVGTTYVWTGPGGVVAGVSGPTLLVTGAAQNGAYSVTLTQRGCASAASNAVSVLVTGLAADVPGPSLTLHPNPADASVQLRSERPIRAVRVRDLAGRLVRQVATSGQSVVVGLDRVPAGSYLVEVTLSDGRVLTRRLLVSH